MNITIYNMEKLALLLFYIITIGIVTICFLVDETNIRTSQYIRRNEIEYIRRNTIQTNLSYADIIEKEIHRLNNTGYNRYDICILCNFLEYNNKTQICKTTDNNMTVYDVSNNIKKTLREKYPDLSFYTKIRNCSILYTIKW